MILIKAILWEDDNSTKAINLNLAFNFVCAQRRCETSSEIISLIMMWTLSPFFDMFLSHFLLAFSQKSWQTELKLFFFFIELHVSKPAMLHILTFAWALIGNTNEAIWLCSLNLHPRNPLCDLCEAQRTLRHQFIFDITLCCLFL